MRLDNTLIGQLADDPSWEVDCLTFSSVPNVLQGKAHKVYRIPEAVLIGRQPWEESIENQRLVDEEIERMEQTLKSSLRRVWYADRHINIAIYFKLLAKRLYARYRTPDRMTHKNPDFAWRYIKRMFWEMKKIFDESQPDVVLIHNPARLLLYYFARMNKIPVFIVGDARVLHNTYYYLNDQTVTENPERDRLFAEKLAEKKEPSREALQHVRSTEGQTRFYRDSALPGIRRLTLFTFREIIRKNIEWLIAFPRELVKKFIKPEKSQLHVLLKRKIIRWNITRIRLALNYKLRRRIFKEYSPEELSALRYAYFPLHTQPEYTGLAITPEHDNPLTTIELLAKMLPFSMKLFVREHIANIPYRPSSFYKQIQALPNVELVSPYSDVSRYLNNASLVVTDIGTTGWEALMAGKPVLALSSNCFYKDLGVYLAGDYAKLDEQILAILEHHDERLTDEYWSRLAFFYEAEKETTFKNTQECIDDCIRRMEAAIAGKRGGAVG